MRIYDADVGHWLNFPSPLLTPPSAFIATYDWLPAVLESILLAIAQSHEPPVMHARPYGVLRELYDAHSQDPASGIVELSASDVLREFLVGNAAVPGVTPRIETIAAARSPEERAAAAQEWLTNVRDVAAQYLPGDMPGAAPGGVFTSIPTRSTASKTPIFRDLAPDVFWATEALTRLLQREAAALARGAATAGTGYLDDGPVVIPEGGTF